MARLPVSCRLRQAANHSPPRVMRQPKTSHPVLMKPVHSRRGVTARQTAGCRGIRKLRGRNGTGSAPDNPPFGPLAELAAGLSGSASVVDSAR